MQKLELNKTDLDKMWTAFLNLGQAALYASHYDLAKETNLFTPLHWKTFLFLPEVIQYIKEEMEILRKTAMNELLANAGDSNSVGKAQLLNAITKIDEDNSTKEGPIFVYTYVPLNEEQEKAPNVKKLKEDIFKTPPKNPFK